MTPLEHNKFVGWAHLGYGGIHLLSLTALIGVEGFMFQQIYSKSQEMGGPPPPLFLGFIFLFVGAVAVVTSIPSIVAGYALLRRKSWAKIAGIIGGAVAATSFPIGTAVAVYTFWFLFSDNGKEVYGGGANRVPPPPPPEAWQPQGWAQP